MFTAASHLSRTYYNDKAKIICIILNLYTCASVDNAFLRNQIRNLNRAGWKTDAYSYTQDVQIGKWIFMGKLCYARSTVEINYRKIARTSKYNVLRWKYAMRLFCTTGYIWPKISLLVLVNVKKLLNQHLSQENTKMSDQFHSHKHINNTKILEVYDDNLLRVLLCIIISSWNRIRSGELFESTLITNEKKHDLFNI